MHLRGAMTVEPADLREVLRDKGTYTALGIVFSPGDSLDGKHFEIVHDQSSGSAHVMVHVQLMPDKEPLFARLGASAGSTVGTGVWAIPQPGTEVGLIVPYGDITAGAFIAFVLGSGKVPAGLSEANVVIVAPPGGRVLVHDGVSGTEDALVKRSEFNAHSHDITITGVSSGTDTVSGNSTDQPSAVAGTAVLRSK